MAAPVALSERFQFPASLTDALALFEDVPGVVACIPGATIGTLHDDGSYEAKIGVQYGETSVHFSGLVRLERSAPTVLRVRAEGQDGLKSIRAEGDIVLTFAEDAAGTTMDLAASFSFSGILAPLGRAATKMVGPQLMKSFGACLAAKSAGSV